jgi:hypothetical protein
MMGRGIVWVTYAQALALSNLQANKGVARLHLRVIAYLEIQVEHQALLALLAGFPLFMVFNTWLKAGASWATTLVAMLLEEIQGYFVGPAMV